MFTLHRENKSISELQNLKVLICHPGTQHSYKLAVQLNKNGYLLKFYTGIAFGYDHIINKTIRFLPKKIRIILRARIIDDLPDRKINRNIFNEIKSLYKTKQGVNQEEVLYIRNTNFQQCISKEEIKEADLVIGYDTSSWIIARRCSELQIPFILDVTIGHPISKNILFKSLLKKYPNWKYNVELKSKKLIALELEEYKLATLIVTPSSFVKNSLIENDVEENKIEINPFGTDISHFIFDLKNPNAKIKFLFFGGLTIRKGLPLLLSVWAQNNFKNAELTIAGFGELPNNFKLPNDVINKGRIRFEERKNLFKEHDVFIFPSNFEGFAQVQIEAAASGLPIISTYNAGGTEIVKNEFNGLIVNAESEKELAIAINFFLNNSDQILKMSQNQKKIIRDFTWDAYGKRWLKLIDKIN